MYSIYTQPAITMPSQLVVEALIQCSVEPAGIADKVQLGDVPRIGWDCIYIHGLPVFTYSLIKAMVT